MRDRNPALPSATCPKCQTKNLRQYIAMFFIQHYGVYCEHCGYKSKPSISELQGVKDWLDNK